MILVTGTNQHQITALRRQLLHGGIISEKSTFNTLISHLSSYPHTFAVLHIVEKRRPFLHNLILLAKHLYPNVLHGVLLMEGCEIDAVSENVFDFVLPISVKPKKLCEVIVHSAIAYRGINPSELMAGSLRYRLFEKDFSLVLKRFSFSDAYTAVLLALMEVYPQGLSSQSLMHFAFLPLGHRSRTNVSHAIDAINRRFSQAGVTRDTNPLICYDREKGYFLRS